MLWYNPFEQMCVVVDRLEAVYFSNQCCVVTCTLQLHNHAWKVNKVVLFLITNLVHGQGHQFLLFVRNTELIYQSAP